MLCVHFYPNNEHVCKMKKFDRNIPYNDLPDLLILTQKFNFLGFEV